MSSIHSYTNHFIELWKNSPDSFPIFEKQYSNQDQFDREAYFEKFQAKAKSLQKRAKIRHFRKDPGRSFFPMFTSFLETVFDFDKDHLSLILSDDFKDVSKDFFYKARSFDPELKPENIYQAMRNVWIMNGLQLMAEVSVKITPSVFAYSMIYPYSDNFLDDPKISSTEKQVFSQRFNRRLQGEEMVPLNYTEQQLYELVGMFEEEFPRENYQKVYQRLYEIQKAQTDSLQLNGDNKLSKTEVQTICFEKGGTSVLADGYLVAGNLPKEQEQALFGYGIYLQLLDDIQDIKEDEQANTKTMFSGLSEKELPQMINKTIHFGRQTLNEMQCFPGLKNKRFLDLMNKSIETMTIESVGLNNNYYSAEFIDRLEKHSPLHFSFIHEKRAQSKSQRFVLFQKYFDSVPIDNVGVEV